LQRINAVQFSIAYKAFLPKHYVEFNKNQAFLKRFKRKINCYTSAKFLRNNILQRLKRETISAEFSKLFRYIRSVMFERLKKAIGKKE